MPVDHFGTTVCCLNYLKPRPRFSHCRRMIDASCHLLRSIKCEALPDNEGACSRNGSDSVLTSNQASGAGCQLQLGHGPALAITPGRESGNDFHPLHPSLGGQVLSELARSANRRLSWSGNDYH
ncbi:uncharacterized protein BDV14DRAFT_178419 [Aspergillus stella-maris]|uniref:uncharacterized protein n=1 Tax=Aspergillus stella-maris TaxID=1810926 RepID=UPI003CCD80D2